MIRRLLAHLIPPAFRSPEAIRSLVKLAVASAVLGGVVVLFVRWAAS